MTNRLGDAARKAAERGWHIFPLQVGSKFTRANRDFGLPDVVPGGFYLASADPSVIQRWWLQWPEANIGLAPAPSGLVVCDADSSEAERVMRGLGLLDDTTLAVETGRTDHPGRHFLFRYRGAGFGNLRLALVNGRLASVSGAVPGLEVKHDRGYSVLPPSLHPSGRRYRWIPEVIRPLPPAAVQAFYDVVRESTAVDKPPIGNRIAEGGRDTTLTSLAGALRRRGASEEIILTAISAINVRHCFPPMTDQDMVRIAHSVSRYQPAPASPLAGSWAGIR